MKKLLTLALVLAVTCTFAQNTEDYTLDGWVLRKDSPNDTIFGKVKDRSTHMMEHINAKLLQDDGEVHKHKRKDLLAVGRGTDLYIVKEKIPKGYGTQLLKVDVRGTITCYALHTDQGATFS